MTVDVSRLAPTLSVKGLNANAIKFQVRTIQAAFHILLSLHLTDYIWPLDSTPALQFDYDFIIVGCGAAGSILANRLSENEKFNVLVIEAGGNPPIESMYPSTSAYLRNTPFDWNFTTINDVYTAQSHRNNNLHLTSGKMFGGSSSLGDHMYDRGDPKIYDEWAEIINDNSWNFENLFKYFSKLESLVTSLSSEIEENTHNTREHRDIWITRKTRPIVKKYLQTFKQTEDANASKTAAYKEPMLMIKDGIRQSPAYAYLHPVKNRRNLHVLKNTEVVEIKFNGNVATGVTAVRNGNSFLKLKAKNEIILSAGAIKTPQLLMLSGIGPEDNLHSYGIPVLNDLPVGKHFQDHLGVVLVHKFKINNPTSPVPADPHDIPIPTIIGDIVVNLTDKYEYKHQQNKHPDYRSLNYIIGDSVNLLHLCSISYAFKNSVCESLFNQTKGFETMLSKIILRKPRSRGYILLQSKDYADPPVIISGFYAEPSDLTKITNYMLHFRKILTTKHFKKLGAEFVFPKLKHCNAHSTVEYWRCYARNMATTLHDYSGTCALGSVVDKELKVYNIKKLRVVDASVIPVIPSGNIQAAVMVIAEKAANMILNDAGESSEQTL